MRKQQLLHLAPRKLDYDWRSRGKVRLDVYDLLWLLHKNTTMYATFSAEYLELYRSADINGFYLILRINNICFPKHWSLSSCSGDGTLKYMKELQALRVLSDYYENLK